METKHTKGEWVVKVKPDAVKKITIGFGKGNSVLIPIIHGANDEQILANAKLIAAAPELLEALIEAKNKFMCYRTEDLTQEALDVYNKVNNAIKKATE